MAGTFALVTTATVMASVIAGHGWRTDAALLLVASAVATAGGYSRSLAVATVRFVVFLAIALSVTEEAARHRLGLLALMAAGALWTASASLLLGSLARMGRRLGPAAEATASSATAAQKFARWKRSLRHLSGWEFHAAGSPSASASLASLRRIGPAITSSGSP